METNAMEILVLLDTGEQVVVRLEIPEAIAQNTDKRSDYIGNWLDQFMPRAKEWY